MGGTANRLTFCHRSRVSPPPVRRCYDPRMPWRREEGVADKVWAFGFALALVALVTTARLPARLHFSDPWLSPRLFVAAFGYAALLLAPALVPLLVAAAPARSARAAFVRVTVAVMALAIAAHVAIAVGDALRVPWYAGALYAAFAFAAAAWSVPDAAPAWLRSRRGRLGLGVAFAFAAAGGLWLDAHLLPTGYPWFHLAVEAMSCLAASLALLGLGRWLAGRRVAAIAGLAVALVAAGAFAIDDAGAAHLRQHAPLGGVPLALSPLTLEPGPGGPPAARPLAETAPADAPRPEAIDLARRDVLLVTWEATGRRHTSLGGAPADVTPNLRALAARSREYTRAYAPSSNTFQSMSSLLALGLPSTVPLRTAHRRWRGELGEDGPTVAEHLAARGARTLWVSHDYREMFSAPDGLVGLDRGFADVDLIAARGEPQVDRRVVDRALQRIASYAGDRFFAWVHLTSPHFTYMAHDPRYAGSDRALHLGEVRYADAQLGRLLAGLEALGRADETIVIVTADHGEEHGEHGGTTHGSTLYEEVVHVPLVVHVPGAAARAIDDPVSTSFVLPWLLGEVVEDQVATTITPLLEAAGGAVVSELLGADRQQVALVWRDRKLVWDAHSGLVEAYDLRADPEEARPGEPTTAERGVLDRFLAERARRARATVR